MSNTAMRQRELTPGELAERAGVTVSALHFYEREGLIDSRRTSGNQRRYHRDVLRRVDGTHRCDDGTGERPATRRPPSSSIRPGSKASLMRPMPP